jgi:NMD protein affecting ribosome stability and mRNA decay
MTGSRFRSNLIQALVCVLMTGTACAATPIVKPTCTISWERSADYWRVAEYHVTVWTVTNGAASNRATHIVKAPITQVSCQEVGANKPGSWQATIQACLKDGKCSAASKPMSFKVAEK